MAIIESFGLPFLKVKSHSVWRMSLELWTIKLKLHSGRLIRGLTWCFWPQRLVASYAVTPENRTATVNSNPHARWYETGRVLPIKPRRLTTRPTRRRSYAIWLNVGTLQDNHDAFANPGEGATESVGRRWLPLSFAAMLSSHLRFATYCCSTMFGTE